VVATEVSLMRKVCSRCDAAVCADVSAAVALGKPPMYIAIASDAEMMPVVHGLGVPQSGEVAIGSTKPTLVSLAMADVEPSEPHK
jgi:hypothetical protein